MDVESKKHTRVARTWVAVLAAVLVFPSHAAELPDFGTPADAVLSKSREAQIGRGVMLQLRNAGVVMDDPFLSEYLSTLGARLASHLGETTRISSSISSS